ncbi:methylmalonyl-CoA epimerase [Luteibaculum oceani]|uniref:Methylmalonyl-CoA epimerase n=1 Tax=Luteibaculum oceani TaxID=1294296 RepID=A0A5C6VPP5_9FLAO|nr:methylmalonyl-CoA epimerase [Luteibaculum oceani]TXC85268.1 methylmalonyl-CoA epimerase [Luteibaculum oceani]
MIKRIEHLGIAVDNLEKGNEVFAKILNIQPYKEEAVEREGVTTSFFKVGESQVELLEASKEESPIAKFIAKKGGGMHHVAFYTDDIKAEMARLKSEGFELLSDEPKPGADGKLICFLHPKYTAGVLVELCQDA